MSMAGETHSSSKGKAKNTHSSTLACVQVMTALAVAREALSWEGQLEARLTALAQAASRRGQRFFTLPEARQLQSAELAGLCCRGRWVLECRVTG